MKKLALLSAIAISGFMINTANAQIGIHVGIGFAPQRAIYATYPPTVQSPDYGDGDDYYYLPDLGVYYNVTDQDYVYFDGNEWVTAEYLPGAYRDYDWSNARRYEVRAYRPYMHDDVYRSRYEGNRFEGWAQRDGDHFEGGYANRGNGDGYRNFDRDHNRYNQPVQYNRAGDGHFDRNQSAYNQPVQQRRDNNQGFDNRAQGFNRQPVQQNRDNNQGFNNRGRWTDNHQNDRSRGNDNRGGDARYGQNNR
ncbi:hypothetical protein [Mucilaginibacter sp.]|uniref:hypothetical protein n=1 Tax=Mucilaginibacter sp. TaxID=1882438 RepID=UPI002842FE4B|nr:hypothetical protein [Mucilaginibacter sp.]MDR3693656.1 hypothetical protein [Mucilaginibacter sp.]